MILTVLIAFLYGCSVIISKMVNYRAAEELGTWNGSLVNYVVASLLAFVILLFSPGLKPPLHAYADVPVYLYAGGAFGVIAFVFTIIGLKQMKVFQSTILILAGQLLTGILFDIAVFRNFSLPKLAGILLMAAGILWDKKITESM